jgi:hypothetical protein
MPTTASRKRLGLPAALLALGLAVSACGGGSGAPTDASEADFCDAFNAPMFGDLDLADTPTSEQLVKGAHAWADQLAEVGTPEGIPDDARAGFEETIEEVKDLDADEVDKSQDMTTEELQAEADDMSEKEKERAEALQTYVADTCSDVPAE